MGELSPVLATEVLYRQAGWVTPQQQEENDESNTVKCNHDNTRNQKEVDDDINKFDNNDFDIDEEDVRINNSDDKYCDPDRLLAIHSSNRNYQCNSYTEHSLELRGEDKGRIRRRSK